MVPCASLSDKREFGIGSSERIAVRFHSIPLSLHFFPVVFAFSPLNTEYRLIKKAKRQSTNTSLNSPNSFSNNSRSMGLQRPTFYSSRVGVRLQFTELGFYKAAKTLENYRVKPGQPPDMYLECPRAGVFRVNLNHKDEFVPFRSFISFILRFLGHCLTHGLRRNVFPIIDPLWIPSRGS